MDATHHQIGVKIAFATEAREVSLKFMFLSGGAEHEREMIITLA